MRRLATVFVVWAAACAAPAAPAPATPAAAPAAAAPAPPPPAAPAPTPAAATPDAGGRVVTIDVLPAPPTPREPAPPPRSAKAILDDAAKAIGGDAAWKAHKSVRMTLEMTFQGIGITGKGERIATKNDKALVLTELPGIGTIREGSNGKVNWAQDPVNGLRILEGAEAEQAHIEAVWNAEQRMSELYPKMESATESGPGGVALECVVLTPKLGKPTTNCYDSTTHLQVLQRGVRATPQGDTPFTSYLKDWREVGGIKMAFSVDTQAGPITFTGRIGDVKFDVPVDDKMFDPPVAGGSAPAAPAKPAGKKKPAAAKP